MAAGLDGDTPRVAPWGEPAEPSGAS